MLDPFSLSVIQSALENSAEEMFTVLRKTASLSVGYKRGKVPVWSLNGQPSGCINAMTISRVNGAQGAHQFASGVTLNAGDCVLIETANGGNA